MLASRVTAAASGIDQCNLLTAKVDQPALYSAGEGAVPYRRSNARLPSEELDRALAFDAQIALPNASDRTAWLVARALDQPFELRHLEHVDLRHPHQLRERHVLPRAATWRAKCRQ